MMSLWDALRMNMMISYQELVRTFLSTPSLQGIRPKAGRVGSDGVPPRGFGGASSPHVLAHAVSRFHFLHTLSRR